MSDKPPIDVFGEEDIDPNDSSIKELFPTFEVPVDSAFAINQAEGQLDTYGKISKKYLRLAVVQVDMGATNPHGVPGGEMGCATIHYVPYMVMEKQAASTMGPMPSHEYVPLGGKQTMTLPYFAFDEHAAGKWENVSLKQIDSWFTELIASAEVLPRVPLPKQLLAMGDMLPKILKDRMPES